MNQKQEKRRDNRRAREGKYDEEIISINRISRMTAGGRRMRFRCSICIGDKKGQVGIGVAKSNDISKAINKAKRQAEQNILNVEIVDGTIPHELETRYSGAHILLKPAAPGTGIIAGGVVRKVLELAGIENVLSKSFGSQNKLNNLRATIKALENLNQTIKQQNENKSTEKNS
jgi:small subunit ribosomal protein S5